MYAVALFRVLATLCWLAMIALAVLSFSRALMRRSTKLPLLLAVAALVGALVFTVVGAGLVFIEPYEMGVVITILGEGGLRPEPLSPGLHWIIPFVERVETYPIARQTFTMAKTPSEGETRGEMTVEARTLDGQRIFVDSSVIYEINPAQVLNLHIRWQHRYEQDLIHPETRGIIRDVVSQYRVDEVVSTKRFEVTDEISRRLEEVLAANGLMLVDFVLRILRSPKSTPSPLNRSKLPNSRRCRQSSWWSRGAGGGAGPDRLPRARPDAAVIQAKGEAEARLISGPRGGGSAET
jgi:hypothetical protein